MAKRYAYRSARLRFVAAGIDLLGHLFFPLRGFRRLPAPASVRRILVVKLDHLGDAFLFTPFFAPLQARFPNARITVLCENAVLPIYRGAPGLSEAIGIDWARARSRGLAGLRADVDRLVARLRLESPFDLAIDAKGDSLVSWALSLLGVPFRVGVRGEEFGSFFHHRTAPPLPSGAHESEKSRSLLRAVDVPGFESWRPHLFTEAKDRLQAEDLLAPLQGRRILAVHAGAGYPYKEWGRDRWATLLRSFLDGETDFGVVLVGSSGERPVLERLAEEVGRENRVLVLAGRAGLATLDEILGRAQAMIGHDSLVAHLAASKGIPVVVLMSGGVDRQRWSPLGSRVTVLQGIDEGHDCPLDRCAFPCPHLLKLDVDLVLASLRGAVRSSRD